VDAAPHNVSKSQCRPTTNNNCTRRAIAFANLLAGLGTGPLGDHCWWSKASGLPQWASLKLAKDFTQSEVECTTYPVGPFSPLGMGVAGVRWLLVGEVVILRSEVQQNALEANLAVQGLDEFILVGGQRVVQHGKLVRCVLTVLR